MENYKKDAKEMLKKATLSEPWKTPRNQKRYVLMLDGEIIGHIKKKVDISKLAIGEIQETWRGRKVDLMHDNKLIGFLWA